MNAVCTRALRARPLAGALAAALLSVSLEVAPADAQKFPEFAEPRLQQGRAVWLETCAACHAGDIAGAPLITSKPAWAPRLAKGRNALYQTNVSEFILT